MWGLNTWKSPYRDFPCIESDNTEKGNVFVKFYEMKLWKELTLQRLFEKVLEKKKSSDLVMKI